MISSGVNTRELILEILLQIEEGEHSHIAIRNALSKYQFLPKQERSFITRVCEGTLEYRIYIDYVIDSFSKVSVNKMKPQIREILRSAVYQLKFMDSAGLGIIIGRYKNVLATGGKTFVSAPSGHTRRLLTLAGMNKIIPLCKNLDEALGGAAK